MQNYLTLTSVPTYILRSKGTVYVFVIIQYIYRSLYPTSFHIQQFIFNSCSFYSAKRVFNFYIQSPNAVKQAPLNSSNTPKVAKTHASERRILKFSNPPKPLSEPHSHSDTRNLPRAFTYKPCKAPSFTYTLQMNVETPTFYLPTYPLSSSNTPTQPPMAA